MNKIAKALVPSPDIHDVLLHLGFRDQAMLMSCRKYEDKQMLVYSEINGAYDQKNKRPYTPHKLVMDLLGLDADAASEYMRQHNLV